MRRSVPASPRDSHTSGLSKEEFLERCWIPYERRLPPDTKELVLVWNTCYNIPWMMAGFAARNDALQYLKDPKWANDLPNKALQHCAWMRVPPPKGRVASENPFKTMCG